MANAEAEAIVQQASLLTLAGGQRFCIYRGPSSRPGRGVVVHAPAFAEEMNKSRRMVAWCARQLAAEGFHVYQPDLYGCGDSPGDSGDASWSAWVDDIRGCAAQALARHGGPLWLWGLRAGALIACEALNATPDASLLVWNPVLSGRQYLQQFLRLAQTATVSQAGEDARTTRSLRAELERGIPVEIAGYTVSPALASGLDAARFVLPDDFTGRVVWIEVTTDGALRPASTDLLATLDRPGMSVTTTVVEGPSFWQTTEIEDCPALVDATLQVLKTREDRALQRNAAVL